MKRSSVFKVLISALVSLLVSNLTVNAAEIHPILAGLSELPGSDARNLALIRQAVEEINQHKHG